MMAITSTLRDTVNLNLIIYDRHSSHERDVIYDQDSHVEIVIRKTKDGSWKGCAP